jgi:hypothetical protein
MAESPSRSSDKAEFASLADSSDRRHRAKLAGSDVSWAMVLLVGARLYDLPTKEVVAHPGVVIG